MKIKNFIDLEGKDLRFTANRNDSKVDKLEFFKGLKKGLTDEEIKNIEKVIMKSNDGGLDDFIGFFNIF